MSGLAYGNVQAANDSIIRLEGQDRYETAAKIALNAYPDGASTVILARGDIFADGLAGSALAGALDAPILLTSSSRLPSSSADAIETLGATDVLLLGGTGAISEAVKAELDELGLVVTRIYGDDRYETAVMIAEKVAEAIGDDFPDTAFIVSGTAMADSLIAGTVAAMHSYPTLLVKKDSVPQVTADVIAELGIKNLFIIGGTSVVSDAVYTMLEELVNGDVERIWGDDRSGTSVAVARKFFSNPLKVILASGRTMVDALAGGYFGALKNAPILLTQSLPDVVQQYLDEIFTEGTQFFILGGTSAVSTDVENQLQDLVDSATPPPPVSGGGSSPGPVSYALTVVAEGGTVTGAGSYSSGATVNLTVTTNDGYKFIGWTAPTGSFDDATAAETTFIMPSQAVTVTANFNMLFAGGNGTEADPFQIAGPEHLDNVRLFLDAYFVLNNDIDQNEVEWEPIGDEGNSFTGHFDGARKSITNLVIKKAFNNDGYHVGLFGYINGATIKDLTIKDSTITVSCTDDNHEFTGALAGYAMTSVIENCHANNVEVVGYDEVGGLIGRVFRGSNAPSHLNNCSVINSEVSGIDEVGGLVGSISQDQAVNYMVVENCHVAESVITATSYLGGLAGSNQGIIKLSSAIGVEVTAAEHGYAGGLVGCNCGEIEECYTKGKVTAGSNVGGLVGVTNYSVITNSYSLAEVHITEADGTGGGLVGDNYYGEITNCYAAGTVNTAEGDDDNSNAGGLVGVYTEGGEGTEITTSFYDKDITGRNDEGKGDGETTVDMMKETTFTGWDFDGLWGMQEGLSYPYLHSHTYTEGFPGQLFARGAGTEASPYEIETAWQLNNVRERLEAYFILKNNIDLSGYDNWQPIGSSSERFIGNFDGKNFVISNLSIVSGDSNGVGLFGYVENVTIKDLTLNTVRIVGAGYSNIGALVGSASGATIQNCNVVNAEIVGSSRVGGLIGDLYGTAGSNSQVSSCKISGTVNITGTNTIGGMIGQSSSHTSIINCSVVIESGIVRAQAYSGGLIGINRGSVLQCHAIADVLVSNTSLYAGGLVAENNGSIAKCYAGGSVTGSIIGGLVGRNQSAGLITDSYSISTVVASGTRTGGGLVGVNQNKNSGAITQCYAAGIIQAPETNPNVGGLVGTNDTEVEVVNIVNCFYDTDSTNMSDEDKGTGMSTADMKIETKFTSWDFTNIWSINEGTSYPYLKELAVPDPLPGS